MSPSTDMYVKNIFEILEILISTFVILMTFLLKIIRYIYSLVLVVRLVAPI